MTPAPSFQDIVARHARERPDVIYVHSVDQGKSLTYGQLRRVSDGIARLLADHDIGPNDRVLLLAENSVEFHAVFVGVLRYGATIVTLNIEMNHAHLEGILNSVRPKIVIVQSGTGLDHVARRDGALWMELGAWQENGGRGLFAETTSDGSNIRSVAQPRDHGVIFY